MDKTSPPKDSPMPMPLTEEGICQEEGNDIALLMDNIVYFVGDGIAG